MFGRRLAATTGTPLGDHFAPGDLGAVDGHDRDHHHVGVDQDQGRLVRLVVHRTQRRSTAECPPFDSTRIWSTTLPLQLLELLGCAVGDCPLDPAPNLAQGRRQSPLPG
jgi:hypothetical protein